MPTGRGKPSKTVETLTHDEARRRNLPSAEHQPLMREEEQTPVRVAYERRNRDLDPQFVWRGKDEQDLADLVVNAPPLYIQERVHPKALIDDLMRQSRNGHTPDEYQTDMFADFNGLPSEGARTEFYQHDANWSNRMILGDSLQVMASLAEREGLRGKVQCIYIDPPYGIKFNSNFQWSTTSRDVRDGNREHITREPEQVKAFRDTWRDGIHSYLTYLRDRLTVARDLLAESGSIFVQIGDENVHRVRSLMDEVFGENSFISQIGVQKTGGFSQSIIGNIVDHLLWYAKNSDQLKYRPVVNLIPQPPIDDPNYVFLESDDYTFRRMNRQERLRQTTISEGRIFRYGPMQSDGASNTIQNVHFQGNTFLPANNSHWKTTADGVHRIGRAGKLVRGGKTIYHRLYWDFFAAKTLDNIWLDTQSGGFNDPKTYVVQTTTKVIQRCILMTTDPGDLALARARVMGARYPYYLLADSQEGQLKQAEIERRAASESPTYGNVRQGLIYERVPHITLGAIASNAEIDVIWEDAQKDLEPLREELNRVLGVSWEEWEIPRETEESWPEEAISLHSEWWERRIARQKKIDASIAANADYEYLYDKPFEDRGKVRVAGPFTVESISPHRVLGVDEDGNIIDGVAEPKAGYGSGYDFGQVILENLKTSGVQQAHREDRIEFTSITPWPGRLVCAEGVYIEGNEEDGIGRRAAIFIGPEFGTVSRPDLVEAAREAADAKFDVLIACAFNYEAHTTEFESLGRVPVLKARMNADLHMADDLKNTGKGNLFVIFGEPDVDILDAGDNQVQVRVNGVDVFHPNTGEVRSDGPEGIACWFIDTDYNEEAFFVRHAYFLVLQLQNKGG